MRRYLDMKIKVFATILVMVLLTGLLSSFEVRAEEDSLFLLAESLLAVGHPSAEYDAFRDAYNKAKAEPNETHIKAMESAGALFLVSLFNPGNRYEITESIREDFSDLEELKKSFIAYPESTGYNLVEGRYKTHWTNAREIYLIDTYEQVKYEFKAQVLGSPLYSGFGFRFEPFKESNMFGTVARGLAFNIVHREHEGKVAIGFYHNDKSIGECPFVYIPYSESFDPKEENTFTVFDYGNVVSVLINGEMFCALVFQETSDDKYNTCYVFAADGSLAGTVNDINMPKKGSFTFFSRVDGLMVDDFTLSSINGLYDKDQPPTEPSPETSDENNLTMFSIFLLLSMSALVISTRLGVRQKYSNNK